MKTSKFTAFQVDLKQPIEPQTAHWLSLRLSVDDTGVRLPTTLLGPVVLHEFASPIDVRRTISEGMQTALRILQQEDYELPKEEKIVRAESYNRTLDRLKLLNERSVDIQYYELFVQTGNPNELLLLSSDTHGDIRQRSGSPRIGSDPSYDIECLNEPVYEWKSGSIIEPAHPWKNSGFSVRLTLAHKTPVMDLSSKNN